jgi:hypothetical protein
MPSETFYCPHCKRKLTKSPQAYVLGEMMGKKDSEFVGLGGMAETVTCPGCGGSIDARKMVMGEYDGTIGSAGCLGLVVGIAVFVVVDFYLNWYWWLGVILGVAAGIVFESIRRQLRGKKQESRG